MDAPWPGPRLALGLNFEAMRRRMATKFLAGPWPGPGWPLAWPWLALGLALGWPLAWPLAGPWPGPGWPLAWPWLAWEHPKDHQSTMPSAGVRSLQNGSYDEFTNRPRHRG